MSKLGGNSPSADTDKSNNLTGPPGPQGIQGEQGIQGIQGETGPAGAGTVATVAAGTNCTVDATDPANPIVNANTQNPNTTKGDVATRDASADVRLPVGTDGQVLTADSTKDSGLSWETPAAGSGGGGSFNDLKPGTNFWMGGELAAFGATHVDTTFTTDRVKLDFVYFSEDTTTISEIAVATATASNGGDITVALHPMSDRVSLGTQDFVGTITVSTAADTVHSETLGTPWVVPKGHYALVTWQGTGANITNIISATSGNTTASGFGKFNSGKLAYFSALADEAENKCMFLIRAAYDTTPDLTSVDWNDETLWKDSPTEGQIGLDIDVPIVIMKVTATT